jgi:hypothetical protein
MGSAAGTPYGRACPIRHSMTPGDASRWPNRWPLAAASVWVRDIAFPLYPSGIGRTRPHLVRTSCLAGSAPFRPDGTLSVQSRYEIRRLRDGSLEFSYWQAQADFPAKDAVQGTCVYRPL